MPIVSSGESLNQGSIFFEFQFQLGSIFPLFQESPYSRTQLSVRLLKYKSKLRLPTWQFHHRRTILGADGYIVHRPNSKSGTNNSFPLICKTRIVQPPVFRCNFLDYCW